MEHTAILPGNAHIPAGFFHLGNGFPVGFAPIRAIQEEHVGALRLADRNAFKMLGDIITGKVDIAADGLPQFLHPFVPFRLISADQGVHRKHIHIIIVRLAAFGTHAVPQVGVINNMVTTHQARQVKGFAGGIQGNGAAAGILADGLGGDVLVAVQNDIRPDFVRNDKTVIGAVDFHRLFQLPALPHAAAGVVRAAEDRHMDVVRLDLGIHILKVHPPHTVFILDQWAVHNFIAVVFHTGGKADVGGAVQQHGIAGGSKASQSRDHAAQHTVFVPDALFGQAGYTVAGLVPADDGIIIFIGRTKIAKGRVLGALDNGLLDGGYRGEIHIRHPHGDHIKARFGRFGRKAVHLADGIYRNGVLAMAVHDGSKIIFHCNMLLCCFHLFLCYQHTPKCRPAQGMILRFYLTNPRKTAPPGAALYLGRAVHYLYGNTA